MFSKPNISQIPVSIKDKKTEDGASAVFSKYYDLPEEQVLYSTSGNNPKVTMLKIFSLHDLKKCIREKVFNGDYRLLCVFPDGTLLFNNISNCALPTLIKICSKTLTIISEQDWKGAFSAGMIDTNHFFIIHKADTSWLTDSLLCYLTIFKCNGAAYVEQSRTALSVHPRFGDTTIHSLGHHRYACHLRGHGTPEFRILIFDIDPNTYQLKERGIIQPMAQHRGVGPAASGECVSLANGHLLTYHHSHDHVQIWDTENLHCVKEWKWEEIRRPNHFNEWCLKIIPLNDPIHLLVSKGKHFYLFNIDQKAMKQITFDDRFSPCYYGKEHVLNNGKILVFNTIQTSFYNQAVIDSAEIFRFQKIISGFGMSRHISRLFLNTKLPAEMTEHVLSYAFNPETEKAFIKQELENDKKIRIR